MCATYESDPTIATTPEREVVVMVGRGPNSSSCPTACTVVPMQASSTTSRRVRRRVPGDANGMPPGVGATRPWDDLPCQDMKKGNTECRRLRDNCTGTMPQR
jgi:hypothetical protein